MFCFALFCFVLFCFIKYCFVLVFRVLFCSILFNLMYLCHVIFIVDKVKFYGDSFYVMCYQILCNEMMFCIISFCIIFPFVNLRHDSFIPPTLSCSIMQDTKSSLQTLDLSFQDLLSRTIRHKKEIDASSEKLESVTVEIRTLALKSETRALAKQLENHAAAIQLCARVDVLDKVCM